MNVYVISGFEGECKFKKPFLETVGKWCDVHEYNFIPNFGKSGEIFKHKRGYWWGKVYLLKKYLHKCDYLLWIDTDCISINYNMELSNVIKKMECSSSLMAMTYEDKFETGVMLLKNHVRTYELINYWENYSDSFSTNDPNALVNNNNECFQRMYNNSDTIQQLVLKLSNTQFTIKHVHIEDRTSETLFMHVPGSPIEDKIDFMTKYSQLFIPK